VDRQWLGGVRRQSSVGRGSNACVIGLPSAGGWALTSGRILELHAQIQFSVKLSRSPNSLGKTHIPCRPACSCVPTICGRSSGKMWRRRLSFWQLRGYRQVRAPLQHSSACQARRRSRHSCNTAMAVWRNRLDSLPLTHACSAKLEVLSEPETIQCSPRSQSGS
jgi:hypothetical protein